ncbi:hypothetical protein SAMN05216565_10670 [Litchfieldia salsa]|uniref:Uncharacterized protein n=1 Tax=Litchfieldia salsa TaxID=930152 RepID=A0A1H0V7T2_9BACI|nr:hypothetical protein SAMN05216565_10670 [Litchfieldia salsa]
MMTIGLNPSLTTASTISYEHSYSTELVMNDVI